MVSVVLLATTLSLAQFGLASRYFMLDLENKNESEKLADACVHIARIMVYNDPSYTTTAARTVSVGAEECTIMSIQNGVGSNRVIRVRAAVRNAVTNLEVSVNSSTGAFTTWNELAAF